MIANLAWRLGCRLVAWAAKQDGATSVRIDARYGAPETDWAAESQAWGQEALKWANNAHAVTANNAVTWTNPARWN